LSAVTQSQGSHRARGATPEARPNYSGRGGSPPRHSERGNSDRRGHRTVGRVSGQAAGEQGGVRRGKPSPERSFRRPERGNSGRVASATRIGFQSGVPRTIAHPLGNEEVVARRCRRCQLPGSWEAKPHGRECPKHVTGFEEVQTVKVVGNDEGGPKRVWKPATRHRASNDISVSLGARCREVNSSSWERRRGNKIHRRREGTSCGRSSVSMKAIQRRSRGPRG